MSLAGVTARERICKKKKGLFSLKNLDLIHVEKVFSKLRLQISLRDTAGPAVSS